MSSPEAETEPSEDSHCESLYLDANITNHALATHNLISPDDSLDRVFVELLKTVIFATFSIYL